MTCRFATTKGLSGEPINYDKVDSLDDMFFRDLNHQHSIEQISGFLYPDDSSLEGKELRLKQQYFLTSATIQHIIKQFKNNYRLPLTRLHEKVVIQINDTHPILGIL